ncbi:sensor histidine kinase [Janibacter sp. GXQ6167]|uniref:sensor histidine kinase n=1 Tax=Janibacter sp. GXQ6167 TaxID=3240791 RepID=UPI0035254881
MTAIPAPGAATPHPLWMRRVVSIAALLGWWFLGICTLALAVMTAYSRRSGTDGTGTLDNAGTLSALIGLALLMSLIVRESYPVPIAIIGAVLVIALSLDPLPVLVAGMHAMRRSQIRVAAPVAALVTVTTVVATWRDLQGRTAHESLWRMWVTDTVDPVAANAVQPPIAWWVPLLIGLGISGIFLGSGYVRRLLAQSQGEADQHRAVAARLGDELAVRTERERIAREVHDVIGHRLSVVTLHAAALEANAPDTRLGTSAAAVREAAEQTADDLHSLIGVLRTGGADVTEAIPELIEVGALVDDTVGHGMNLIATVTMNDVERLDQLTSRTAYRIVQEMLTNARRHAPAQGVRLVVRAYPHEGVLLESANYFPPGAAPFAPGRGMTGMRERAEQVGGEIRVLTEGEVLRVAVHLPWRWRG